MSKSIQKLMLLMLVQMTTADACSSGNRNQSSGLKAIRTIPDKSDEASEEENSKPLAHAAVANATESKPVDPPVPSPLIKIEELKSEPEEPIKQKPKTQKPIKQKPKMQEQDNEHTPPNQESKERPLQSPITIKMRNPFNKHFSPSFTGPSFTVWGEKKDKKEKKGKKDKKK